MTGEKVLETKSFAFCVKAVDFVREYRKLTKEYDLFSQFLCSATSVGANISEAQYAQSKKDFVSKLQIARKEANESLFWLRLFIATKVVSEKQVKEMIDNLYELMRLLSSSIKTALTPSNDK